jgi:WXXGXW repeat (2 copies)
MEIAMRLRRFCSVVFFSLGLVGLALPLSSEAQVICNGNASPPPELPVYDQPPMPAPGYMWTPGYWGGGSLGYFWVPGTWVEPPSAGLLWTPGYWGAHDGVYAWNAGYWGSHVGFYGGVNYGFGYGGAGYQGGRWVDGAFSYNRTVNNFGSVHVTNVYNETIVNNNVTRVSFNGGTGGTAARPSPEDEAFARERHIAAIPAQVQHERTAGSNKELLATENHGRPAIAATARPGEFTGKGVTTAREATPGEEHPARPNGAEKAPAITGERPGERDEGHNPRETLKEGVEPRTKGPEEKPVHEQAKVPGEKPLEKEGGRASHETLKEEVPKEKGLKETPAHEQAKLPGEKPGEKTEGRGSLKEEGPKAKGLEEKPAHEHAATPGERPEPPNSREKSSEAPGPAAHQPPPHAAAEPNTHANPKPIPKEKKPPG